jgi:hypothetical protein
MLGEEAFRQGRPELQWANMPESWVVFVLLAVVSLIALFVFWLYNREINTCPRPLRMLLAAMRFTVLLLLVLMFLKPSVVFRQVNVVKGNIALLRDSSLSFSRQDKYLDEASIAKLANVTGLPPQQIAAGSSTRAGLLQSAFDRDNAALVGKLREKGSIRVVDFAETASIVEQIPATETGGQAPGAEGKATAAADVTRLPLLVATGRGTDIWQALREMLGDAGRLSSIIIASDGQHTGSEDPLELARKAKDLGIPVYTIGVGDPSRPRNLSITDLYVRDKVPVQEPFEIEALLYAEDIEQGQVSVELLEHQFNPDRGELSEGIPVETRDVAVPPGGGRMRAEFQHRVAVPGTYAYSIRIAGVDGESSLDDNMRTSNPVQVMDQKVKVLMIAGAPTWEYQMLQRLLQRDQNIILSCWLQTMDEDRPQEGNAPISVLPGSIEELGQYNVVMMIDPNPEEFDENWIGMLKQFCRLKAGGLFYMAGPKHTAMFMTLNRLSGIRDLLPVRFGDAEFIDTSQVLASTTSTRPGEMLVVNHNLGHPVMSFVSDSDENSRLWKLMPSIYWSFPTLSPKPTSLVLMERGDQINVEGNQPLLVAGRYGAGNVLYMGFNGTWRWRRVGVRAQYFDRFWIQVVNFLVETRSLQGKRRGLLNTDRRDYELGDEVMLTARVLDERFEELTVPEIGAAVRDDEGRARNVALKLLPGQSGEYEARFVANKTGVFQVVVNLPGTDSESGIEAVTYRVKPPATESRAYWLNEKLLREIAEASGGGYLNLRDLDQLDAMIPRLDTTTEYSSPPRPLWDMNDRIRFLTFLLPFLLLTAEWAVRKKFKLL